MSTVSSSMTKDRYMATIKEQKWRFLWHYLHWAMSLLQHCLASLLFCDENQTLANGVLLK